MREVYTFLLSVLEDKEKKRKKCQVLKSLLFAEHLQVKMLFSVCRNVNFRHNLLINYRDSNGVKFFVRFKNSACIIRLIKSF